MPYTNPYRIAVLGSCVSRDAFGMRPSDFGFNVLGTISRSSLISLLCPAPARFTPRFSKGSRFEQRSVSADLAKTSLKKLLESDPQAVVIDLIDERFGLMLGRGGHVATASRAAENSNAFSRDHDPYLPVSRKWNGTRIAFARAARMLLSRLRDELPQAEILLHRAYWATQSLQDGSVVNVDNSAIEKACTHNSWLAASHDIILDAACDLNVPLGFLDVDPALRVIDPAHHWGPAPFHFIAEYYAALREQIADRLNAASCRKPARSPAPPLAPLLRHPTPDIASVGFQIVQAMDSVDLGSEDISTVVSRLANRAALDDPRIACRLGRTLLYDGLLPQDRKKAFNLFVFAALSGVDEAVLRVGECLLQGYGAQKDTRSGIAWIRAAEKRGVVEAGYRLGQLYLEGRHLPHRPDAARAYFRRAAEAGVSDAARDLSLLYRDGVGGEADAERARFWNRQVA